MSVELRAFSGVTGAPERRIPFDTCPWSDSINEEGSMTVTVSDAFDADALCAPWKTILALFVDGDIRHAGYVKHQRHSDSDGSWTIDVGGGSSVLEHRLVLNYALMSSWRDGQVVVDEDNPSGNWPLSFKGSYSDIVRALLLETMKWGPLPITVANATGGQHERNYNSYDYATVYDRIRDITQLEDGPEVRFDPYLDSQGFIRFRQRTEAEIIDNHWRWNASIPGTSIAMLDTDIEGEDLCSQSFGSGGRDDDKLLVARSISSALTAQGYPVLQTANTEHSSVSELATLQSYVRADTSAGSTYGITRSLKVDISLDVRPGDWADVRTPAGIEYLKITDVSGDLSGDCLSLQAVSRY